MSLVSCRIIRWSPPARWGRSCSNAPNLHAAGALLIHLLRVVASAATPLRPDSPAYRSVKFSTDDSVYDTTGDDTELRVAARIAGGPDLLQEPHRRERGIV